MRQRVISCISSFALFLSAGCASVATVDKGPAVLFEWAEKKSSHANGEDKKGGGDSDKSDSSSDKDEKPDEVVADRPDFTEAANTVGKGRVQLEAGYTFARDRNNGERFQAHSYPEALLRVGAFAEWLELRVGQNFAHERTTSHDGNRQPANGLNDLYLGTKLGLTEQKEWRPELALILQTTVPTGSKDFSAREMLPGINLLYSWDVIEDCLTFGGSTQANRAHEELDSPLGIGNGATRDHSYVVLAQALTTGFQLSEKVGAYAEWFAFFPHSAIGPSVGPEHYLDGGFTYKLTPTFQLDIRAGIGLNRRAVDFFAGTGFAVKY